MAASSSTRNAIGRAMALGACSTKKTAIPSETGTASIKAISDDTTVPKMNGRAPNCSCDGFHSRPIRKPNPNRSSVGMELRIIIKTIAATISRMVAAATRRTDLKILSPRAPVCAKVIV